MTRKATTDGGKRNDIIVSAQNLFFQNGYEGTSVRAIMTAAGAEVGLFYYYFSSKDEVFDLVVQRFVEGYRSGFDDTFEKGVANPKKALQLFFEFVRVSTVEFRRQYDERLHWAIRRAIREKALEIIEPYIEKIITLLIESGMSKPPLDQKALAIMLTHGIGGTILHADDSEWLNLVPEMKKAVHLLLGSPAGADLA